MPRFPFNDDAARSGDDVRAGPGEGAAGGEVHLQARSAAAGDRRRPAGARAVQLRAAATRCEMEQWEFDYDDDTFEAPPESVDYPVPRAAVHRRRRSPRRWPRTTAASCTPRCTGEPVFDEETGERGWVDEDRAPITPEELAEAEAEEGETIPVFYRFTLWRDALLNGEPRLARRRRTADSRRPRRLRPGERRRLPGVGRRPGAVPVPAGHRARRRKRLAGQRHAKPGAGCRRR